MAKKRKPLDEEIDAVNREIERIFDEMPPHEVERHLAEAKQSERQVTDDPDFINGWYIDGEIADDPAKGLISEHIV